MNHLKFYKCPTCGNLVTSIKSVELSCCGNKLSPVSAQTRSEPEYQPVIQEFDGQYSIKFNHPMTKSNYISQVIVVRYDQIMTVNLYAESEAIITIPQVCGIRLFLITNKSELIAVTVQKFFRACRLKPSSFAHFRYRSIPSLRFGTPSAVLQSLTQASSQVSFSNKVCPQLIRR